jgi:hypothetical protein
LQKKFKFTAIGYGNDDFNTLRKIAAELGGSMEKAAAPTEL